MQFVNPSIELINEIDNFKRIERAGRTCYKSENKITNESAYPFFQRMIKNGHTSVLEHSVVYVLSHDPATTLVMKMLLTCYTEDTGYPHYIRYSKWGSDDNFYDVFHPELNNYNLGTCIGKECLFSGNIRAWRKLCERYRGEKLLCNIFYKHPAFEDIFEFEDHSILYPIEKIETIDSIPVNPEEYEYSYLHYPITLRIVADRGVVDEFARHRSFGISVESSRYCNYKDSGVTFVFPYWFDKIHDDPKLTSLGGQFGNRCYETEVAYQEFMKKCNIPQIARGNLTLWVKSEIAMTGTIQQWIDLLSLRDSPAAHPEAQKIAKMIEKVLVEEVGVKDIWGVKVSEE